MARSECVHHDKQQRRGNVYHFVHEDGNVHVINLFRTGSVDCPAKVR